MSRISAVGWGAVVLAALVAVGQGAHQNWELRRGGGFDGVRFTVRRFEPGRGRWTSSSTVPFARFHGLSPDTIDHGGKARFEYVQDPGKLVCQGSFSWGSGAGSFTFVPNPQFVSELQKLGYDAPNDARLFSMMMSGVSLEFARAVRDAGLNASIEQLSDLRDQGVTLEFVRDAVREGYTGFSARDYIDLRAQGVSIAFLRDLQDSGYNLSAREIVNLRAQGVDADFLHQLRSYGLHPSASDLVQLRMQGVTPRYLDGLRAAGYDGLSASEIVSLHAQGVPTDFVQACRSLGYHFSPRELVELRNSGVDAAYLRNLRDSGMRTLSAEEIRKLRQSGVE
jgi:hypothetical protein